MTTLATSARVACRGTDVPFSSRGLPSLYATTTRVSSYVSGRTSATRKVAQQPNRGEPWREFGMLSFTGISREWQEAGREPALDEVLADPIVHLIMRRDSVGKAEINDVIARARAAQAGTAPTAAYALSDERRP